MSKIWYIRVSTEDQNEARQVEEAQKQGATKIFLDKLTGCNTDRAQFQAMMNYVREDDEVYFHELDRGGRDAEELFATVRVLKAKGVTIHFVKENLRLSEKNPSPSNDMFMGMLAVFAQFERKRSKERQREGIEIAKRKGVFLGRAPKLTEEQIKDALQELKLGVTKVKISRKLKINRDTLSRALKAFQAGSFVSWEGRKKLAAQKRA